MNVDSLGSPKNNYYCFNPPSQGTVEIGKTKLSQPAPSSEILSSVKECYMSARRLRDTLREGFEQ